MIVVMMTPSNSGNIETKIQGGSLANAATFAKLNGLLQNTTMVLQITLVEPQLVLCLGGNHRLRSKETQP